MIQAPATWHQVLAQLPSVQTGRWAIGGSAALALHALPVVPRDLDIIADESAASELIHSLGDAIRTDEAPWDRGDVRAARRATAVLGDFGLEILVGVEAMANGVCLLGPPDLNEAVPIVLGDRWFPVLSLPTMLALFNVTGDVERAEMVSMAIGGIR